MRLISILLILFCSSSGQLFSQSPTTAHTAHSSVTFTMDMGAGDKGTETYKLVSEKSRHLLTSTVHLRKYGEPIVSEQQQELTADWRPVRYFLKTRMAKEERATQASVTSGKIQMRSSSGSDVKDKTLDLRSPAVVFDNVVPSQFQILMNEYNAFHVKQPLEFQMLAPQVMAEFSGTLVMAGKDKGALNQRPVELRRYALTSRGMNLAIWTDTRGQLMRVSLPKKAEFVREGFKMDGMVEPAKPKSLVMLR